MSQLKVTDDLVVSLNYVLRLDDGEVVDDSTKTPLQFLQGRGHIIPGLEQAIYGMRVGDERNFIVPPSNGFGEYDPEDVTSVSRNIFPPDLNLIEGLELQMQDEESGETYQAYVAELGSDDVILDFNHPLAGESLYFHVKVVDLRMATAEEISHGHVHDNKLTD